MRPFSLLVKPTSADCNLRCRYCFYIENDATGSGAGRRRMSDSTLDRMISGYMATAQPVHSFGWQGGEPTLMGVDFFRRVVQMQVAHARPGTTIANGLQTNGTLLNDEFAAFLAEYRFLVGVSLDGPAALHDADRRTPGGKGSHAAVLSGIKCLQRCGVEFNILALVSRTTVSRPVEIYEYLVGQGFLFHQYIECVEFQPDGSPQPYAVTGPEWGDFMCRLFDRWYRDDTRRVSVRLFDSIVARIVNGVSNVCTGGDDCRQYFVVEHSGDVYPCDFHVRPEWRLGNVATDTWQALDASPLYATFGARKRAMHSRCSQCEYRQFCQGDCPKNRGGPGAKNPAGLSHLCEGWKQFYDHTLPRFRKLAGEVSRERMQ